MDWAAELPFSDPAPAPDSEATLEEVCLTEETRSGLASLVEELLGFSELEMEVGSGMLMTG